MVEALKGGDKLHAIGARHAKAFLACDKTVNVGAFTSFGRKVSKKYSG
jgi:hypothetical protein